LSNYRHQIDFTPHFNFYLYPWAFGFTEKILFKQKQLYLIAGFGFGFPFKRLNGNTYYSTNYGYVNSASHKRLHQQQYRKPTPYPSPVLRPKTHLKGPTVDPEFRFRNLRRNLEVRVQDR